MCESEILSTLKRRGAEDHGGMGSSAVGVCSLNYPLPASVSKRCFHQCQSFHLSAEENPSFGIRSCEEEEPVRGKLSYML